ncbi:hypothetical protein [Streptomyces formicae]
MLVIVASWGAELAELADRVELVDLAELADRVELVDRVDLAELCVPQDAMRPRRALLVPQRTHCCRSVHGADLPLSSRSLSCQHPCTDRRDGVASRPSLGRAAPTAGRRWTTEKEWTG